MPLLYYPRVGEIVVCHFDKVALGAEMIKSRPAIVIGPRLRRRANLVGIIPLSTTAPSPVENYHHQITLAVPLPKPFDSPVMWAKCDMFTTVSTERLDRFKIAGPRHGTPRKWVTGQLDPVQIASIQAALRHALGLAKP